MPEKQQGQGLVRQGKKRKPVPKGTGHSKTTTTIKKK
jgi:hypothetical protein